jgi:hypothetical protein
MPLSSTVWAPSKVANKKEPEKMIFLMFILNLKKLLSIIGYPVGVQQRVFSSQIDQAQTFY